MGVIDVLHVFRAAKWWWWWWWSAFLSPRAWHVLSMLVLTFAKTHSYIEGRGHGFYRRLLLGFISGIEKKSRNEVRDKNKKVCIYIYIMF